MLSYPHAVDTILFVTQHNLGHGGHAKKQEICPVCREACKLDPKYITNFGEEVVRGQPVFVLSILLQKLEPMLREAAGVAPWQVSQRICASASPVLVSSIDLSQSITKTKHGLCHLCSYTVCRHGKHCPSGD